MNSTVSERLEIVEDYINVDWGEIIPVLMAFAYTLIGNTNEQMNRSREDLAYDFTIETIKSYLGNPEKFDPSKNPDLISYLKYYILRQLISNYKKSGKNKKEVELSYDISSGLEEKFIQEANIVDAIDFDDTFLRVETAIVDKPDLKEIFDLRYFDDLKRDEICTRLAIEKSEYDNRLKRLKRILGKILTQQNK